MMITSVNDIKNESVPGRGGGRRNSYQRINFRRAIIILVLEELRNRGKGIDKELILRILESKGYQTSKRVLERDLVAILGMSPQEELEYNMFRRKIAYASLKLHEAGRICRAIQAMPNDIETIKTGPRGTTVIKEFSSPKVARKKLKAIKGRLGAAKYMLKILQGGDVDSCTASMIRQINKMT